MVLLIRALPFIFLGTLCLSQAQADLLSLFLTVPCITLAAVVAWEWRGAASSEPADAMAWLTLGVMLTHIGQVCDNGYWSIPWSLHYLTNPLAEFFFSKGVYPNITGRQTIGILASICHLISVYKFNPTAVKRKRLIRLIGWSFATGTLATAYLWYIKHN